MKNVYIINAVGDMGKDHYYYVFDSEEKANIAYDLLSLGADEMAESDEEYERLEEIDNHHYDALCYRTSIKELNKYIKDNDMDIVAEYECIII